MKYFKLFNLLVLNIPLLLSFYCNGQVGADSNDSEDLDGRAFTLSSTVNKKYFGTDLKIYSKVLLNNKLDNKLSQLWRFKKVEDGKYNIYSLMTNRCLDLVEDSIHKGSGIQTAYNASDLLSQIWAVVKMNNGYFHIKNEKSGKCLQVGGLLPNKNENILQLANCDKNGLWILSEVDNPIFNLLEPNSTSINELYNIINSIPTLSVDQKNKIINIYNKSENQFVSNSDEYTVDIVAGLMNILSTEQSIFLTNYKLAEVVRNASRPRLMRLPKPVLEDVDSDGVSDQFDMEPNTPGGCPVDTHGISLDTDGDGVPDCRDKELITPTVCQPVDKDGIGKCPYYESESETYTYSVGIHPELGGYVFYVTPDGKHGLVAATKEQGTGNWFDARELINNPANHNADGQRFIDWRMPTKFELNKMYSLKSAFNRLSNKIFWSSGEDSGETAWAQDFSNGSQDKKDKQSVLTIRAVRSF